ncbi:MAG: aldehyde dehydrogenase family protein [Phycisphaerales bacterium]
MAKRLPVNKTHKLFIGGAFPRSESGRVMAAGVDGGSVSVAHASRKDLRDAVEAARKAFGGWSGRDAYNRGQILYRLAEMIETRRETFAGAVAAGSGASIADARREVDATVDRVVCFAGWTDKFGMLLGSHDPVAGPYHVFTVPEAVGVTMVVGPDAPALLGLVTLVAAGLATGSTIVAVAGPPAVLAAVELAEACATSDIPAGAVNILTGHPAELAAPAADHRGIDAIVAAGESSTNTILRAGAAENLKRVRIVEWTEADWADDAVAAGPDVLESFLEMKTLWHPAGT